MNKLIILYLITQKFVSFWNEVVLSPYAFYNPSVITVKNSWAIQHVVVELAFNVLSVRKHKNSFSFFEIFHEIT